MKIRILYFLALVFATGLQASEIPEGWFMAGSNAQGYDFNLDVTQGKPAPSGNLKSNEKAKSDEFGTLMQSFIPEEYIGKRIKMTAWVKSKGVASWAGLWMRIDTSGPSKKAFDNMQDRAIKGDTEWTQYSIVLDVANSAKNLSYGILISGSGETWFDNFEFSIVDDSVPVTSKKARTKPVNNSF